LTSTSISAAEGNWIPFTTGDYWVLKIDSEYSVALIGTPHRRYLWILSRQPQLAEATKAEYLDERRRQGFDLSNLIGPRHTGREVRNAMVEDL
jgi:apolipoprotein D and lipocalin family protein